MAAKAADAIHRIGRKSWQDVPHVSRVIASPMVRTQETAAAVGRRLGLHVETDDRLQEVNFGDWEGLTGRQIMELCAANGTPEALHEWRFGAASAPGGESIPQVGERMNSLVIDLAAHHAASDSNSRAAATALVSHAVAIKSLVGISMKMDPAMWGSMWPQPASLTMLQLHFNSDGTIAERHLMCLGSPTSD